IVLAIQFEERDLVSEHGAAYEEYRHKVPMLLPRRRPMTTKEPADTRQKAKVAIGALALVSCWATQPFAQGEQTSALASQHHQAAQDSRSRPGDFVKVVRDATERFKDVSAAEAEGYALLFGCVSGSDWGAMG